MPQATEIVIAMLMFFSIGFVPLDQYPGWLQPIVEHQPVSYTIEAMRGLSLEGPIAEPVLFDGGVVGGHRRGVRGAAGDRVPQGEQTWLTAIRHCNIIDIMTTELLQGVRQLMFPSSGIRKLARSEEMFAETHNFVGLAAHVDGPVDADALSDAFDLLLQAHPVLGGHLEQGPDGKWEIVLDDLMHEGIEVVELDR